MGYQFVHLECWSRKADSKGRSTSYVFDEAERKPIACVHVQDPTPPITLYGVDVAEVRQMHDTAAAVALTTVKNRQRKIRLDQKTLHSVVASHPYTVEEVRADKAKFEEVRAWEKLSIVWLREKYGPALKCVIRHVDEKQWHIHAYILPSSDPELRAQVYHPGVVAKRSVKAVARRPGEDAKALNKRADAAYKAAMREWQDSYHESVAVPAGLTRLGPARRRLSREEWKAEMTQARALQIAQLEAEKLKAKGQSYIAQVKLEAAAVKAEAAKAKAGADRLKGIGGAVRSVIDGINESAIRAKIRGEFARDLAEAKAAVEKAKAETDRERATRRESDASAERARLAARRTTASLSSTQAEVRRLSSALAAALDEPTPAPGGHTL